MNFFNILFLLIVTLGSCIWYFKIEKKKDFFSFVVTEVNQGGPSIYVLKLEEGVVTRKFVAASPVVDHTPAQYGISEKRVSGFLSSNREGYGQRIASLMRIVQQREQEMMQATLYGSEAAQTAQVVYRQAYERVQDELLKVYRRISTPAAGMDLRGFGYALYHARKEQNQFDVQSNAITLVSAMKFAGIALDFGLLSRSAYENFLDSCEGKDETELVALDIEVRREIMKYVDDPKQERKLRRRQTLRKLVGGGEYYPLDNIGFNF